MAEYLLQCSACGYEQPETNYVVACPKCSGLIEVILKNSLAERKFDDRYPSIFRYHKFMPFEPTEDYLLFEDIKIAPEFVDSTLSEISGVEIIAKDEIQMPTGTWKDLEGFVSIHRLLINKIPDMVLFSSGNTGTSLARSASKIRGPRIHIVVPKASEPRVRAVMDAFYDPDYVKLHFFEGSNDECVLEAKQFALEKGFALEGGFTNYARREGLKLLALEHIDTRDAPVDWYAQPVASGIGVYSFEKACVDAGVPSPRILGVQADICSPMVRAWEAGVDILDPQFIPQDVIPSDFVRVLRTRDPSSSYPIVKKVLDRVDGRMIGVSDDEIYAGLRDFYRSTYFKKLYKENNILVGLEAATVFAGVCKAIKEGWISKGSRVLLNVSGAAKQGDVKMEWVQDLL